MKQTPIETITNIMITRANKRPITHPKAHSGYVTLRGSDDYEEHMIKYVYMALSIIISRFSADTRDTPRGQSKLTELSAAIGRTVVRQFTDEDIPTAKQVNVGNCFIGAFYEAGYVHIYRDTGYSEYSNRAPYIVEATTYFGDLAELPEELKDKILTATQGHKIPDVTTMLQGHGRTFIKGFLGMSEDTQKIYTQALSTGIANKAPWWVALNNLQQTAWMINREVYEIVDREFSKLQKPVPPRPGIGSKQAVNDALKAMKANDTAATRKKYNKEVKLWNRELESLIAASKKAEMDTIKEKAEQLLKHDQFYQYVELDYRGRAYIQEPFMNFQGNDTARGMFLFADGEPIGIKGYKWLAIHTASVFNQSYGIDDIPEWCTYDYKTLLEEQGLESISVDKMTLTDRNLWTWRNMDKVLEDSHKIVDCEKPVSYLAACIEWRKAHEVDLSESYVCHLPIPIDGTCNGYQHSAAIAKDEVTGALVSLVPQEVPTDLYVVSAKELAKRKKKFFTKRPTMKMKDIRKSIAKRAVMTRAYSAGKDKMSDSMYRDCHQLGYTNQFNISMIDCMELSSEMYELIKDVCPGATRTMEFLQNLATFELGTWEYFDTNGNKVSKTKKDKLDKKKNRLRKIKEPTGEELEELNKVSQELNGITSRCTYGNGKNHLRWVTPSGFPVVYEVYRQRSMKVWATVPGFDGGSAAQPGRVQHVFQEPTEYPDTRKYQSGIAPNFIHSMDATHMSGVAAHWTGAFSAVHDSFSTHACDVDELAELTREVFVKMYDVYDPYAAIAEMILSPCVYDEELPELGSLDITEVRNSPYFFC